MLIKCSKGYYHLKNNFRDAFNEEAFCEAYLEECFDNDSYIVGDIAAGILRLKGFNNDPKSPNYYGFIDDYLEISCVVGSPYYVLRRISEAEYNKIKDNPKLSDTDTSGFVINELVKESFDKESLVLESNPKHRPNIELNMQRINSIPQGKLPDYLREEPKKETKEIAPGYGKVDSNVQVQSYVSSSNGFDPSKVQNRNQFNKNKDKKNKDVNNKQPDRGNRHRKNHQN
ncbi:MAG: YutD family protein [Acholeplasmatales bacterium]|nr:YutD family protein [Acholeplasmatales bacterium]